MLIFRITFIDAKNQKQNAYVLCNTIEEGIAKFWAPLRKQAFVELTRGEAISPEELDKKVEAVVRTLYRVTEMVFMATLWE
jgi:hypothetical protein